MLIKSKMITRKQRKKPSVYNPGAITGPLQPTADNVSYRKVLTGKQHALMLAIGCSQIAFAIGLAVFLSLPGNLPKLPGNIAYDLGAIIGLIIMVGLQIIVAVRTWGLVFFASKARDPIPMVPQPGLRVAVMTTIVPGKEPIELVMNTLRAMKRIRYNGQLDVWLLDEGNDAEVRRRCHEIGVRHFSRKGIDAFNQESGPFRAKTKHGNHNAWRSVHEHEYDVIAQMDPDHVPFENFLERTLGYFADPDTAFVVAPQVYGNMTESFVARGAAELAYIFHGIIQRGGNGHGAPLLIGTNHLYRPSAFNQIGGYQDCIIEDHLTSMVIYGHSNPVTGNRWRGVYTPDILAVGEGPATYADFFSQQKRWAYGIWEIATKHSPKLLGKLRFSQRLSFFSLQFHYPTTAISWVGGVSLNALYLIGGVVVTSLPIILWVALFPATVLLSTGFTQYLRRFNLTPHERKSLGLTGMVLELLTIPVYTAAAVAQLTRRKLVYVVTAKGKATTADSFRVFRAHAGWASFAVANLVAGQLLNHTYRSLYYWTVFTLVVTIAPLVRLSYKLAKRKAVERTRLREAEVPTAA